MRTQKARDVQKRLEREGWIWLKGRGRGSHRDFIHPGRNGLIVVPWHRNGGVPLPFGTFHAIAKKAGWVPWRITGYTSAHRTDRFGDGLRSSTAHSAPAIRLKKRERASARGSESGSKWISTSGSGTSMRCRTSSSKSLTFPRWEAARSRRRDRAPL
ncbi:MAG: type II toxin-antitoxin system HicA family toxin [Candidatus Eremiobacteraeota bacterium]|nr:type II toxin-antitoxin system HicA family toxin [Candidatus Eremiobacteraeota bacterium]